MKTLLLFTATLLLHSAVCLARGGNPPRLGDAFQTTFLGNAVTVPAHDLRHLNSFAVGAALNLPTASGRTAEPMAALYLWRRPDDDQLFYGDIAVVYNRLFFAHSFQSGKPFEWVTAFENYTLPLEQSEIADGRRVRDEEILWGYVRSGAGVGMRGPVAPFGVQNMASLDFLIEPGYLYFGKHNQGRLRPPQDTFELRTRLQLRWDAMARGLLSLPQRGFTAGADAAYGHRFRWRDWGTPGQVGKAGHDSADENYAWVKGYLVTATAVPFVANGRHRLVAALHGFLGHHMDRFNHTPYTRLSGGINAIGEEYHSSNYPFLPGAALLEFYPERYLVGYGEYRFHPVFFAAVSTYGGAGYLNPLRAAGGRLQRRGTVMPFAGARIATGFFGSTRLVLDFAHNFGIRRKDDAKGGNQIVLSVAGEF